MCNKVSRIKTNSDGEGDEEQHHCMESDVITLSSDRIHEVCDLPWRSRHHADGFSRARHRCSSEDNSLDLCGLRS